MPLSRGEKVGLPELEAECGALLKRQIRRGERHSRHEGQFRKRGRGDDCRCGVFDASWILSIEDAALGNLTSCTHRIAAKPSRQDRRHRGLHSRTRMRRFSTTLTAHLRRRERPDRGCNGGAFCFFGELKPLATTLILCPATLAQSRRQPSQGCAKFARSAMAGLFVCARSAAPSPDQAKHRFLLGLSQPGRVEDKIAAADRSFEPR